MKLKLYKPGKVRKEGTLQFELREGTNKELELVVYDNKGGNFSYAQHVLDITEEGIIMHSGVADVGLPYDDEYGTVQVSYE